MKQQKKHKAPGYADLLLDTLKVLASHGGAASIEEIHDGVVATFEQTERCPKRI